MVALLQDFRRAGGLILSSFSADISDPSASARPSACAVCIVGDRLSVRGDLCGGPGMGLGGEHLFDVAFIDVSLVV